MRTIEQSNSQRIQHCPSMSIAVCSCVHTVQALLLLLQFFGGQSAALQKVLFFRRKTERRLSNREAMKKQTL